MRVVPGHFEIPARDPDRAARFYRRALGWCVERLEWEGEPYFKLRPGEEGPGAQSGGLRTGGGLTTPDAAGVNHPVVVLHVEGGTLEECLAQVEAEGGTTDRPPRAVGTMGRYATFRDPEGNLLGLWQPGV